MTFFELLKSLAASEANPNSEVVFTDYKTGKRYKVTSVGYIEDEKMVNLNNTYDI